MGSLRKRVGYYTSWDTASIPPEDIDLDTYNYINYAFLNLDHNGRLHNKNGDNSILTRLGNLKRKKSHLKLLLSVGGWSEGCANFSTVAAHEHKIVTMAESAIAYIKKYNFDGLDIDWEYPASTDRDGSSPRDKKNFVKMLKIIRNEFSSYGYLLTIAVSAFPNPTSYDVEKISGIVDFINVMTYDFHHSLAGDFCQNAPLYPSSLDSENDWRRKCNCDGSIKAWLDEGTPKSKLVLGLAFYGQMYSTNSSSKNAEPIAYKEIAKFKAGWSKGWDSEQKVPYKESENKWIGFDNARSIARKVKYAKKKGLGGVMVWAINQDNGDLTDAINSNI